MGTIKGAVFVLVPTGAPALASLRAPWCHFRTTPPLRAPIYPRWRAVFSGCALRVSTRTLSVAKQGEGGASGWRVPLR